MTRCKSHCICCVTPEELPWSNNLFCPAPDFPHFLVGVFCDFDILIVLVFPSESYRIDSKNRTPVQIVKRIELGLCSIETAWVTTVYKRISAEIYFSMYFQTQIQQTFNTFYFEDLATKVRSDFCCTWCFFFFKINLNLTLRNAIYRKKSITDRTFEAFN